MGRFFYQCSRCRHRLPAHCHPSVLGAFGSLDIGGRGGEFPNQSLGIGFGMEFVAISCFAFAIAPDFDIVGCFGVLGVFSFAVLFRAGTNRLDNGSVHRYLPLCYHDAFSF